MQYLLIRNARLANGSKDTDLQTILVADGKIVSIGKGGQHPLVNTDDFDAKGRYVIPSVLSLCNPRPSKLDDEALREMNFENLTSGVTNIMTVSNDVEDNILEMSNLSMPTVNYTVHMPLRQVYVGETRRMRKIMVLNGVATAIVRFGDERRTDLESISPNIAAARSLGLRVLYDFRGVVDPQERITKMSMLCEILQQDRANRAYILGVENEEELSMMMDLRGQCDLNVQLCYDPFGQPASELKKLSAEIIVDTLRNGRWCSIGLAYSVSKAMKEGWPDMTPEIVGRNKMPLINAIPVSPELSMSELVEYAMVRPATYVGLKPMLGHVTEGASANLLIWDDNYEDLVNLDTPRGNIQNVKMKGKIDAVIMNGRVVVDEKFNADAVNGRCFYARII